MDDLRVVHTPSCLGNLCSDVRATSDAHVDAFTNKMSKVFLESIMNKRGHGGKLLFIQLSQELD